MNGFHKLLHWGQKQKKQGHAIRTHVCKGVMRVMYQCDISLEAEIDESVYFCHKGFGIVINPAAKIRGGVPKYSIV